MQAPSYWWTIGCTVSLITWSSFSTWYVRRLWADAHAAHAAGQTAELAFARARRWGDHVYAPVAAALAVPTLVLAVWGVL